MANIPRYWLTIHWPHPVSASDDHAWFVYLQHRYRSKGDHLSRGDKVVFYEAGTGKPHRRPGSSEVVPLKRGRQAVVGIAEISGPLRASTAGQTVREYGGGETLNWAWEVPCDRHQWGDPVPLPEVLRVIERGTIRIPGGLVELDRPRFDELQRRLGLAS